MIKTRFDETEYWVTSSGEYVQIDDMETSHIINTMKMLVNKPMLTQTMLIRDIERTAKNTWTPSKNDALKESLNNITSMSLEQTKEYIAETPLVRAFMTELKNRGINVITLLENMLEDAKVEIKSNIVEDK